jgi:eukaryotic-like serine/threonine-protein kinase
MAVVFLAEDRKHQRQVAVKVLRSELAQSLGADRFLKEIAIAAQLTHPHVLPLHDSGEADGLLYYVMPFVEGESLRDRLRREHQLPVADALRILRDVADALAYAHSRGIVHRDIKPENILLTGEHAVVTDFGIARAVDAAGSDRLTETGLAVGTPWYMSPEQAGGADRLDGRADIYSLGCVAYEMLAGEPPFTGPNLPAVIARHTLDPVPPLRTLRPAVPEPLVRAIEQALAKLPADRFATAAQFADALGAGGATSDHPRAPVSRPRRLAVGVAATGLLAAAAAWWVPRMLGGGPSSAIRSVAVLPLANLTGDSAEEYFVDGIHEALIADLSRISGLRVISRTSVLQFRGTTRSIPEIAGTLHVDAVIEGSVLRAGDSVRILASLIGASTDQNLGTVTHVAALRDVLGLLRDVAWRIAGDLAAVTARSHDSTADAREPVDPAAYDVYLRARHLMSSLPGEHWLSAPGLYHEAIARDSTFGLAQAGLAWAYFVTGYFGLRPQREVWPLARETARRALRLDDGLAEAHTALGYLALFADWDLEGAERSLRRALALAPNDAMARHGYADLLAVRGRPDESLAQMELARAADPLSPLVLGAVIGHLYLSRRFPDVLEEAGRFQEMSGRPRGGLSFVAASLWELARYDEALATYRRVWAENAALLDLVARGEAGGGPPGALRAVADYLAASGVGAPYDIAAFYARAGERDGAFQWLERALDHHGATVIHFAADPAFDVLHEDPRFGALLARIGLPATTPARP